jgi:hypothetical protein
MNWCAGVLPKSSHLVERGRLQIATIAGPQDMAAGQDRLQRRWPRH